MGIFDPTLGSAGAVGQLMTSLTQNGQPGGLGGSSDPLGAPADDLAQRVRAWYLDFIGHPLWKQWLPESLEDMGYYIGGKGQWSRDGQFTDYEYLKEKKRTVVSVNHIASIVDLMSGYERANRVDIKASPQGDSDVESARLMSAFLKYAQDQTQCPDTLSDVFEDGNITGMDVAEVGIDYTGDRPIHGEIFVDEVEPGRELTWDPHWRKYDFSDCRAMLKHRWAYVVDVVEEWPDYREEILAAVGSLREVVTSGRTRKPQGDGYGYVRRHPIENLEHETQFYNPEEHRILVIEAYYQVWFTKWIVYDEIAGTTTDYDTKAEADAVAEAHRSTLVPGAAQAVTVHRSNQKRIRKGVVIPAAWLTVDEDANPYPNDDQNYPFVPYIAKRKRHVIYGIVRNLKDPQRIENKRWSQVMDHLAKFAMLRPMLPKGSLDNPQSLSDASADSPIEYDPEKGAPGWWTAPLTEISNVLTLLATQMKMAIREISGINTDLLGQKQDTASGVAIARRQQQGQVIATVYYDNFRKTRKLVGQRLARRIQQVYTKEDTLRLTDEYGAPMSVEINPRWAQGLTDEEFHQKLQERDGIGKPRILRSVQSLKFEVVISEAPATPTARAAALMALLEIAEKVPAIAPALLDKLVELADIPDRTEIVARVKGIMARQGLIPGAPPNSGPPNLGNMPESGGAPPGGPTAGPPAAPPMAA